MKTSYLLFIISVIFILSTTVSCKKIGCYDEDLYQQHKDDACTMDCPGVTGCDGKTYCNKCIANSLGIRVE